MIFILIDLGIMMVLSGLSIIPMSLIIAIRELSIKFTLYDILILIYFLINTFTYLKILKKKKSIEKENERSNVNTVRMALEKLSYIGEVRVQAENAYLEG